MSLHLLTLCLQAGIPNKNITIALEPECASIYCQHLSTVNLHGATDEYLMKKTGQKYVVVDLGGKPFSFHIIIFSDDFSVKTHHIY